MDCELANDDDPATEPKASAVACDKVGGKYTQLMGEDPPCETAPSDCPCAAMEVYADAFGNAEKCFDYESMVMLTSSPNETIAVAAVPLLPDVPVCGSGLGFEEPVWEFLEISSDDANTCMADLRARAAELGLICETAPPRLVGVSPWHDTPVQRQRPHRAVRAFVHCAPRSPFRSV